MSNPLWHTGRSLQNFLHIVQHTINTWICKIFLKDGIFMLSFFNCIFSNECTVRYKKQKMIIFSFELFLCNHSLRYGTSTIQRDNLFIVIHFRDIIWLVSVPYFRCWLYFYPLDWCIFSIFTRYVYMNEWKNDN